MSISPVTCPFDGLAIKLNGVQQLTVHASLGQQFVYPFLGM